ncbi:polynucleotide 3'-phosphatase /polynucleotide 5'-hydroxyl-kinase /polynucleotide 2',3'-cyclic phosphate phosphodiesterase [Laceyella sediminis]|uniref:Polynucleotide 3'-phosphatase /polynucleotide 5'-hydroxyl-kinase /polynucleotide 2',3'-cyclic phosphate phosphodiesterase n=3 Tax=Laceyella TaxID=292635 RepID=A0ABX5EPC9_9BACL|nr:polynucleotide 3'-phosphatase /polynucleotide 5'-hydroxyl-kinase /polynucleotide 2',3'-cyclic phosphate phosphodiesterase [Laceyella sediminis]
MMKSREGEEVTRMQWKIPECALVVLIGASGSGKSTFARRVFKETEVLSSDFFRAMVSDDEGDQSASSAAFELLHQVAAKRLERKRLTVIDATNVHADGRKELIALAKKYHMIPVAFVMNMAESVCYEHNAMRERKLPSHVIKRQHQALKRSLRNLKKEGFRYIYKAHEPKELMQVEIVRERLWVDKRDETGPFDIIGDVHGCYAELVELLTQLGYRVVDKEDKVHVEPPVGRKAIFLGDLVDRGPDSPSVLRLVMSMVESGAALCVPGNHDVKLLKKLDGRNVQVKHGLEVTLAQLDKEPPEWIEEVRNFLRGLVSHYVLDEGRLVVAHAGMKEEYQGRASGVIRDFALYGETTGEIDAFGLPVRLNWAESYRGSATVVYGHTPIPEPTWLNRTLNIDTGCVFGGKLTALRYPENELVSVAAKQVYAEPVRPLEASPAVSNSHRDEMRIDVQDVLTDRIQTRLLRRPVHIRKEQSAAALETMSRFAIDPKWLIYLPPTMSPSETSEQPGYLEHPEEAFGYYAQRGVKQVICEEKHMGSRAVVIACRDKETAVNRFDVADAGWGVIYTRTGRRFFEDASVEQAILERLQQAITRAGLWDELQTDWMCLDCELMPWSAKAQELIRQQYALVGAASRQALAGAVSLLKQAAAAGRGVEELLSRFQEKQENSREFVAAYRRYSWRVNDLNDYKLAPFHLLATEGRVYTDRDHLWHMETIGRICREDTGVLMATRYLVVNVENSDEVEAATAWWLEMTESGGEGMVVKPLSFIAANGKGLLQPAVKCRGREYLRLIYGPDYTEEANLTRLRNRSLKQKRSLALREFALGLEGLMRFVDREPLHRVHACAFGVMALESEPVDPRL